MSSSATSMRPSGSGGAPPSAALPLLANAPHCLRRGALQLTARRAERGPCNYSGRLQARGFSLVELLVSMAIMLSVMSLMFGIINAARGVFEADLERADMQQRARVSTESLFRDLVMAGAGSLVPAVAPFRRGTSNPDTPGSAFSDRISVLYAPPDPAAGPSVTLTYALRGGGAGVPQLAKYDGVSADLPVVDQVSGLRFEYFDGAGQVIPLARFMDGPWVPNAVAQDRFDADLQAIRRVRMILRVRPARALVGLPLADLEVCLDVSPRNLNVQ